MKKEEKIYTRRQEKFSLKRVFFVVVVCDVILMNRRYASLTLQIERNLYSIRFRLPFQIHNTYSLRQNFSSTFGIQIVVVVARACWCYCNCQNRIGNCEVFFFKSVFVCVCSFSFALNIVTQRSMLYFPNYFWSFK